MEERGAVCGGSARCAAEARRGWERAWLAASACLGDLHVMECGVSSIEWQPTEWQPIGLLQCILGDKEVARRKVDSLFMLYVYCMWPAR